MLDSNAGAGTGATEDGADYFRQVILKLNGATGAGQDAVSEGDVWTIGVNYKNFSYEAEAGDGIEEVAEGLAGLLALENRYAVQAVSIGDDVYLLIGAEDGFNLRGLTSDGVTQEVQSAATVTRSFDAMTFAGDRIAFESARITLTGPAVVGDLWSITVYTGASLATATTVEHRVTAGQSLTQVARVLEEKLEDAGFDVTPDSADARIEIDGPAGFGVRVSVAGAATGGAAAIEGDIAAGATVEAVVWTSVEIALGGDAHTNEVWRITVDGVAYTATVTDADVAAADTLARIAGRLLDELEDGDVAATRSGSVVTVTAAGGASVAFSIDRAETQGEADTDEAVVLESGP